MDIIEPYYAPNHVYKPRRANIQPEDVCLVVESVVSASYRIPVALLHAPSRCIAPIAFARQIAMYISHVWLGLSLTEVGRYFGRDRTTVAHACGLVEDRRENRNTDRMISSIETAVDLWLEVGRSLGDDA